jgi:hypothetical protein
MPFFVLRIKNRSSNFARLAGFLLVCPARTLTSQPGHVKIDPERFW